jgi:hypothetical protein
VQSRNRVPSGGVSLHKIVQFRVSLGPEMSLSSLFPSPPRLGCPLALSAVSINMDDTEVVPPEEHFPSPENFPSPVFKRQFSFPCQLLLLPL